MTIPSHAELLREYLEQLSQSGGESRLPAWKEWRRLRLGGAMALGAALSLAACNSDSDPQGNQGGAAGMAQAAGAGGLNMTPLYAAPMGGNQGNGGQPSAQGGDGSVTASGGFTTVALYAIVMESGGTSSS